MVQNTSHRKGQTLAEFALTLPILLLLIFGIIEFGRIFQAWVTLQNAARAAARYASTGQVNYDVFELPATVPDRDNADNQVYLDIFVPCLDGDQRNPSTVTDGRTTYQGPEALFANWYDGTDCEPTNEDHQQYRRDMMRLVGIMYEARESVNSLGVEWRIPEQGIHYYEELSPEAFRDLLYSYWGATLPRHDQSGFFSIDICSSRGLLDPGARDETTRHSGYPNSRFVFIRSTDDLNGLTEDLRVPYPDDAMPFCMLNERPLPGNGTDNSGLRWLDAGGPGERVSVNVTFNHPLITPLRLPEENYIRMQARRSIVNESFRAPKAVGAFQRSLPKGSVGGNSPQATWTPFATNTPTFTPQPSNTPSNTPTATREPFTCNKVSVGFGVPPFDANRIYVQIFNDNYEQTELLGAYFEWRNIGDFPNMYMAFMSMYGDVFWRGNPADNTNNPPANSRYVVAAQNASILANPKGTWIDASYKLIGAQSFGLLEGIFFSAPGNLVEYLNFDDIAGTFIIRNPIAGQPNCRIQLPMAELPTATPTDPNQPTPTVTPTPRCVPANNSVTLRFGGFDSVNGSVFLELTNNNAFALRMVGFRLVWPDRNHPQLTGSPRHFLPRVLVAPPNGSFNNAQLIWQSGTDQQDATGNTRTAIPLDVATFGKNPGYLNAGETPTGTWVSDATIQTGTSRIYLDFDGFLGSLAQFGATSFHFNESRVIFGCARSGGSGGSGGGSDSGEIPMFQPTPTITNTPRPTNTRGPSPTPRPATATWTATQTRTPLPPSQTPTPRTPTFTPSRTPFGQPTPPPVGGGE